VIPWNNRTKETKPDLPTKYLLQVGQKDSENAAEVKFILAAVCKVGRIWKPSENPNSQPSFRNIELKLGAF
jgi:hypothetical protein